MRNAIFFVAFVVMAAATFPDINSWIEKWPVLASLPSGFVHFLLHVPYALLAVILLRHAEIAGRLPSHPVWYVLLAVLVLAHLFRPYLGLSALGTPAMAVLLAKPALIVVTVMTLLRLQPRPGDLYAAMIVPAVRVFIALTLLLSMSFDFDEEFFWFPIVHKVLDIFPARLGGLCVSAILVAVFIVASRLRHRTLQPSPVKRWLTAGIVVWVIGEVVGLVAALFAAHVLQNHPMGLLLVLYAAGAGYPLRVVSHVLLFIGAFYLFSHLLKTRAADEQA